MNADERRWALNQLTERIIGSALQVSNTLGIGFLEKVYENALAYELRSAGYELEQQYPIDVYYKDQVVGHYLADMVVENRVLVELKVAEKLEDAAVAQCLNYLRATGFQVCLLMNVGTPRVETRRLVNHF
jgi:GxxExxY protein